MPGSANWPEKDITTPTLIVPCAAAGAAWLAAAIAAIATMHPRMICSPDFYHLPGRSGPHKPALFGWSASFLGSSLLHVTRIFDIRDLVDVDIAQLVADLFDAADVNRLHDVAGLWIDHDRPARAFPAHALGGSNQGIAVGLARGLLQGGVDQVHAIVAADGEEIRVAMVIVVVGLHERLVQRRLVIEVVIRHRDNAERAVTHAFQRAFAGQRILTQDLGLRAINAAFRQRLADGCGLGAAGHPDVDRVGTHVLGALNKGGEVWIGDREAHRTYNLAAGILKAFLKPRFGVDAGSVVGHHSVYLFDAVLGRPIAQRVVELRRCR